MCGVLLEMRLFSPGEVSVEDDVIRVSQSGAFLEGIFIFRNEMRVSYV